MKQVTVPEPVKAPTQSFSERAGKSKSQLAAKLFQLMEQKKSNLSVAVDVTRKEDLLRIAEQVNGSNEERYTSRNTSL